MKHNDGQLGKPEIVYTGTKTAIEALSGISEGAIAYATDTNKFGSYNGSSWDWGGGAGATAFTGLTDTFAAYTGLAGKYVKVNAGETGLDTGVPTGAGDVTQTGSITADHIATYSSDHVIKDGGAKVDAILSGWIDDSAHTWTYVSADGPTGVFNANYDATTVLSVGMRVKFTQTTVKYGIITAVGSYSGGNTPITIYGGTDYTLANAAISANYYSPAKAPFGFPLDPDKWSVIVTDSSDRTQATPTQNTWYNLGSISISIPIGLWRILIRAALSVSRAAASGENAWMCLSTGNNNCSDTSLLAVYWTGNDLEVGNTVNLEGRISAASKTTYYLNERTTTASTANINVYGSALYPTVIKAICAYL